MILIREERETEKGEDSFSFFRFYGRGREVERRRGREERRKTERERQIL